MTTDTCFLVGAGASVSAPANLPLFGAIRSAVVDGLPLSLRRAVSYTSPEALLRSLVVAGVDVASLLREAFNSVHPGPNCVHGVLGWHLLDGSPVWTTNYDTLIEAAVRMLAQDDVAERAALGRLEKPHGTFSPVMPPWKGSRDLVFDADQVVAEWPASTSRACIDDVNGRPLVVIGYGASDVNSFQTLRQATAVASSCIWYEYGDPDQADPPSVLPVESGPRRLDASAIEVRRSWDPSAAFVRDMGPPALDLTPFRPDTHTEQAFDGALLTGAVARPIVQSHVARELGEGVTELRLLEQAARDGREALATLARRQQRRTPLRQMRRRSRQFLAALPPDTPATDAARARTAADYVMLSPQDALQQLDRLRIWSADADTTVHRLRLDMSRCQLLRALGRFQESLSLAERCLTTARDPADPLPTEAARAAFEVTEAARLLGQLDRVDDILRERVASLGMAHWSAWMDLERAIVCCQRDEPEAAWDPLGRALAFWRGAEDERNATYANSSGPFFARLVSVLVARCNGRLDEAEESAAAIRRTDRVTPHRDSILWYHAAEVARARGDFDEAEHAWVRVDRSYEAFDGIVPLGRALVAANRVGAAPAKLLDEAEASFRRIGLVWGLVRCRELRGSRRPPSSEALRQIAVT